MLGISWGFQTQFLTILVLATVVGFWWTEKDQNRKEE